MVDVNDLGAIQIGLSSPEQIRKWSRGEVKKPETINYRTLKPEKDGLFCEKIFGPTKDWECHCGKYKRIRHKGVVCDRCGVEITRSAVRRERLGHIELAAPVSHIWYFKSIPSKMALLLGIMPKNLEKVLYFASGRKREDCYKVTEPGSTDFEVGNTIRETEYKIHTRFDSAFKAEPACRITDIHELPFSVGDRLTLKEYTKYRNKYKESFTVEEADNDQYDVVDVRVFPYQRDEEIGESELHQLREIYGNLFDESVLSETAEEPCFIVIDPGGTGLKEAQMILETEAKLLTRYDPGFRAGVGAEAIREIFKSIDVQQLARRLRKELKEATGQKAKKLIKRLQVIESFCKSGNRPDWMVLEVIPVLPPDLRPMVQLDGGRFATSDLNDLYRRVINRNNRLKRLLQLGAPGIIVKNEKRMLQEAVDALFDNGRRGRPVLGSGNRPLKSLSDMLRGKKGRFRQNLLGKRVDYSGRSVIVAGPRLNFDQCGLPKKMALELFKPFIMKKLVERGYAHNIKSAKRKVEKSQEEVWEVLEEVISEHPVLLNRAPTLHRMSIQSFQPILVEGNAIQLHPLVCTAFNADFDGDQMAVHVPLSAEAQAEAQILMLSAHNVLSPASGRPIAVPTQDMVLGCYYLTLETSSPGGPVKTYCDRDEALLSYYFELTDLHQPIRVRSISREYPEVEKTTIGRIIFNELLPEGIPYVNEATTKKRLSDIVDSCFRQYGNKTTVELLDRLKEAGFHYATKSGATIGVTDLEIPAQKTEIIEEASRRVEETNQHYNEGLITWEEREQSVIDIWTDASNKMAKAILEGLEDFNPVDMMAKSGARGSIRQISQLAGMRGLMADPSGRIIEYPIKANFREGLGVLEYFISTHGARKGLADTALRTAKSGYLTRRLVDVAQDLIIREIDCGKTDGIVLGHLFDENDNVVEPFEDRVLGRMALNDVNDPASNEGSVSPDEALGRTAQEEITSPETGEVIIRPKGKIEQEAVKQLKEMNVKKVLVGPEVIVAQNQEINETVIKRFKDSGISEIPVRSVLTCRAKHGVCALCYGRNLSSGRLVDIGEAVGIVAAQSIGEPGTQLTMRTFHTGGIRIAGEDITQGLPRVEQLFEVRKPKKAAVLSDTDGVVNKIEAFGNRRKIHVRPSEDEKDQTIRTYLVPHDIRIKVTEGDRVQIGQQLTLGSVNPRDILRIKQIEDVQKHLVEEIQSVYLSQGVNINDKHVEVICRQIARLNKVMVENSGDTELLSGELVFIETFKAENARIDQENQDLVDKTQELLLEGVVTHGVADLTGEALLQAGDILTEAQLDPILSNDCKPFTVHRNDRYLHIVRGYKTLKSELSDRICIEDILDRDGNTLVKAGALFQETNLELISELEPRTIKVGEKAVWERLRGAILAEDVTDPETGETLLTTHGRIEPEHLELFQHRNITRVTTWKQVEVFPIKENLVRLLREEILGQEVAQDVVNPRSGEVIVQAGHVISRSLARRLVAEGIKEVPLADGRFFSLEGRLSELLETEVMGKIAAQTILGSEAAVLIKAGEIFDRDSVIKIAEDTVDLLYLRNDDEPETHSLVRELVYLPGLKQGATGRPVVLGITKASLATESFLSAASFQQTTHVLADAAIKGKVDELVGLKENVIIGKIIPAGTGFSCYRNQAMVTPVPPRPRRLSDLPENEEEEIDLRELMDTQEEYEGDLLETEEEPEDENRLFPDDDSGERDQ